MRQLLPLALAGLSCCVLAACATQPADTAARSRSETVAALKAEPAAGRVADDTARARASLAWGDRWTAANLFEQAHADRSNIVTRFNRATAYQQTGRSEEAAALYRDLVRDGQYKTVTLDPRYDRATGQPVGRPERVNVADESARRLAMLQAPAAIAMPRTAGEAAVNAAAVEGRPRGLGDDEALARDAAANPE